MIKILIVQDIIKTANTTNIQDINSAEDNNNSKENIQNNENYEECEFYKLGCKCWNDSDYSRAIEYFEKSDKNNNPLAQFYLGRSYKHGRVVEKNDKKAFKYFKKSSNLGNKDSQFLLSTYYYTGKSFVNKDIEKSIYWLEKSSEQGHIKAKHRLNQIMSKNNN